MHNNYYFLRHISQALHDTLAGAVVSECYSQNKDELIIRFETTGNPFFVQASLLPSFSCLSFPATLHRAKKNSVDLFQPLIGSRVMSIQQFTNERSFAIHFTNQFALLFKMHGSHANLILFEKGMACELFKKNKMADAEINLLLLDRPIDWSYEYFIAHRNDLTSVYFTFGKIVWRYLNEHDFATKNPEKQWNLLQETLTLLQHPGFFITEVHHALVFSLLPLGNIRKEFTHPLIAINEFYSTYLREHALLREKQAALTSLQSSLRSSEHYYEKTHQKLEELKNDAQYKIWADLVMANLHTIQPGMGAVTLANFYNENSPVEIKLKKDLSPQKNAEVFYRKAKNQQIELEHVHRSLQQKTKEIAELKEKINLLEATDDLKTIRQFSAQTRHAESQQKQPVSLPYHEVEYHHFKIWIGRNAACNDTLTLKYSYKEDLWLHAKDVAGSHVLLKYQAGKNFPKEVIDRAAQLAAYHSKRKNESLCPVVVTQKKYVRKRKGDPAGAVIVERENVIMVPPIGR